MIVKVRLFPTVHAPIAGRAAAGLQETEHRRSGVPAGSGL